MTTGQVLTAIGAVIALGSAVVAVLAYVAAQRDRMRATTDSTSGLLTHINRALIDYPALYPYFMASHPCGTTDKNRDQVLAMSHLFLNVMDSISSEVRDMDQAGRDAWPSYFVEMFAEAPTMLAEYRHYYDGRWYPNLKKYVALNAGLPEAVPAEPVRAFRILFRPVSR